jgi:hypothetical protein
MNSTVELQTKPRPLPLTITGWWLAVSGIMSLFSLAYSLDSGVRAIWASFGISPVAAIVPALISGIGDCGSGIAILQGKQWGRTLYLVLGAAAVLYSAAIPFVSFPMTALGLVVYIVLAYILSRPSTNAYFEGTYEVAAEVHEYRRALRRVREMDRNASDIKRVFAVLFAAVGGVLLSVLVQMPLFASGGVLVFMGIFFGLPAVVALAVGVWLWGRRRWAAVVGWTVSAAGSVGCVTGIYILILLHTSYWKTAVAASGAGFEIRSGDVLFAIVTSMVLLLGGAAALVYQRNADIVALEEMKAQASG